MTLGSLFSGMGGFELAAHRQGIKTLWNSEFDKHCQTVTNKQFPNSKQLGDITRVNGSLIEPVDIISFGSPCQDLSVAGKQAGLQDGKRSNLFYEAIRIINEMRKATNNEYPRFAIWENVPGAFSSNEGNDFKSVLESLTNSVIPMPKSGRWAKSGLVRMGEGSLAWRTIDAQYFGVPQRRKRIFLVADFREQCARKILFEQTSKRWDTTESGSGGQDITSAAYASVTSIWSNFDGMIRTNDKTMPTLMTGGGSPGQGYPCILFEPRSQDGVPRIHEDICPTLNTSQGGQRQPCICIAGNTIGRQIQNGGNGKGVLEETSYTLNTTDRHATAYGESSFVTYKENRLSTLTRGGEVLGGGNETFIVEQLPKYQVRRLTPTECLRFQGYPDNWLDGLNLADTQKYKMIGNSVAIPCVEYIFERLLDNTPIEQLKLYNEQLTLF